jgi:uncharacterized protein (UPF0254 family)
MIQGYKILFSNESISVSYNTRKRCVRIFGISLDRASKIVTSLIISKKIIGVKNIIMTNLKEPNVHYIIIGKYVDDFLRKGTETKKAQKRFSEILSEGTNS